MKFLAHREASKHRDTSFILVNMRIVLCAFMIASLPQICLAITTASSIPTGLVSYWNFDGDVVDSAGGRTSTGGGSFSTGVFGSASVLNGTDEYIDIGTNAETFFLDSSPFTIALWYRADSSGVYSLFSFDDDTGPYDRTAIYTDSTGIRAGYTDRNGSNSLANAINVGHDLDYEGEWVHVALTANPAVSSLRLYVNGVEEDAGTGSVGFGPTPIDSGAIGRYHITGGVSIDSLSPPLTQLASYFDGTLDDLAVWNRELTPAEIALLGLPDPPVTPNPAIPEPSTFWLAVIGCLVYRGRRTRS